jgi:tetratricopeptide (TPR) repeat protein
MQLDSALFFLNRSLKIFEAHKDTTFIYEALYRIAATHSRQANYIAAIEVTLQNMNFIRINDTMNRVRGLSALARCYDKSGDTEKAKCIQYEALRLAETTNDTFLIGDIAEGLSPYLAQLGQGDSALWAIKKNLNLANANEDMQRLDITYLYAGLAYKVLNDFTQALGYSQKAFYLSDSMQDKGYKLMGIKQIADCYLLMGDGPNAHKYYAKALNFLDSIENTEVKMQIYDSLTVLSFRERNDVEGLRQLRASKAYAKKQFSKERQQIVENMNIRYETAQRKEQINDLNQDKKTLQLQLLIGVLFFVSALGFSTSFIYRNRQRQILISKENELLMAKEQATQLELIRNKQQLDAFTANILAKNQLISDLEARISALSETSETRVNVDNNTAQNAADNNTGDNNDADNHEENREKLANMKILTDSDWKLYLTYFTQVHKDFMARVDRDLQDLSAAELRLFMLLKQGFDSKNMADVLGISMAGIKKSRHRLRKRLNLSEEDNLEAFVQAF